jgi:hypothetical protein
MIQECYCCVVLQGKMSRSNEINAAIVSGDVAWNKDSFTSCVARTAAPWRAQWRAEGFSQRMSSEHKKDVKKGSGTHLMVRVLTLFRTVENGDTIWR